MASDALVRIIDNKLEILERFYEIGFLSSSVSKLPLMERCDMSIGTLCDEHSWSRGHSSATSRGPTR